jgi:hypothetical protein
MLADTKKAPASTAGASQPLRTKHLPNAARRYSFQPIKSADFFATGPRSISANKGRLEGGQGLEKPN